MYGRFPVAPPPSTPLHFQRFNPAQAKLDMFNAIKYAPQNDFLRLLDSALGRGAKLNELDPDNLDVLSLAVKTDQPEKMQILLAKGARLPEIPESGKGLLMEAASHCGEKMIALLIDVLEISPTGWDKHEQTALHYAAKAGNKIAARALLMRGADPDDLSGSMDARELATYFAGMNEVTGKNVTPLMLATAKSDSDMIELLQEYDADPHIGVCLPLTIAMKNDNAEIMSLLIKGGADPFHATDANGKSLLKNAIINGCSIVTLRLIANRIPIATSNSGENTAIGNAVCMGNTQAVALLLASGYNLEDQQPNNNTIWDIAEALENADTMLDILAASRSDTWENSDNKKIIALLARLPTLAKSPADLASAGLFQTLLTTIRQPLYAATVTNNAGVIPCNAQLSLLAAYFLAACKPMRKESAIIRTLDKQQESADTRWIEAISGKKSRQAGSLLKAADSLMQTMREKLSQLITQDYFLNCGVECPDEVRLQTFINNKLCAEDGFPDEISAAVTSSWHQAAKKTIAWHIAPDSLDHANRFVTHMAASLLEIQLAQTEALDDTLLSECKNLLLEKLDEQARPLITFCANPVIWLRNHENRNNLKPVEPHELTNTIQIELGLPRSLCNSIVEGWSRTINQARNSNAWRTTADLQRLLEKLMARVLTELFQAQSNKEAGADFPVPAARRMQLLAWCEQAVPQTEIALIHPPRNRLAENHLRRPAEAEAPDAPPAKKPRL